MSSSRLLPARRWLLLPGGAALVAGLGAALGLGGLATPVPLLADQHGMLMVVGFLGTLISLERAAALRARWALASPALLGVGVAVSLLARIGGVQAAQVLALPLQMAGTVVLLAIYLRLSARNHDPLIAAQWGATAALLVGLVLHLRLPIPPLVAWLVVFIVATIAAERVELARIQMPAGGPFLLAGWTATALGACVCGLLWPDIGARLLGLLLLGLVGWLVVHDVARRTIRLPGLPRLSAAALLGGYVWLALSGLVLLTQGQVLEGYAYDIVVHACFVGFALSMVMAHAPVILPSVLDVRLPYRPAMWLPLIALQVTLTVRVVAALAPARDWWQLGLGGNVVSVLLFAAVTLGIVFAARKAP